MGIQTVVHPFSDITLGRRLERAEARSNASFVETRARLEPGTGAAWIDVAGAFAMFDGVGSPLTQTFGLGLFDQVGPAELDRIEQFFFDRAVNVFHEVSPLAGVRLYGTLAARGYRPIELTSVMCQPIEEAPPSRPRPSSVVRARQLAAGEEQLFANVSARGWSESAEAQAFMAAIGEIIARRPGGQCFLAEVQGMPIAAAVLDMAEGVALLAGASTVPEGRRLGAQQALLDARLAYARARGCDLAMVCAAPGSASQRNAERQGFRIAYTRTKWELERSGPS